MGIKAALATAALAMTITITHASPSVCWIKDECRTYVGKRLWVSIPSGNPNVVEVTFTQHDWTTGRTLKLKSGASFFVTGLSKPQHGGSEDYAIKLDDGRKGWISSSNPFLVDFDPAAARRRATEECERRGQPKIGMSPSELVETCWRRPARIVKKTTAAGIEESYIYGVGHMVKVVDGKVTEIIEAR